MIELSDNQKIKLANLFKNKKFSEIEFEIEAMSGLSDRTAFLSNLLGIAKIRKTNSIEDATKGKGTYIFDPGLKHFFVIIIPNEPGKTKDAKMKLSNFNSTFNNLYGYYHYKVND